LLSRLLWRLIAESANVRETVFPVEGLAIYFCFCVFEGVGAIIVDKEAGICLFDWGCLDACLF